MRLTKKTTYAAILTFSLFACEKEVFPTLESQENLVVTATYQQDVTTGSAYCQVSLATSNNFLATEALPAITSATVTLLINGNEQSLTHIGEGIYYLEDIATDVGATLRLRIDYNNRQYEATERLAPGVLLDSISVFFFEPPFGSEAGYYPAINVTDTRDETNFYLWNLYINDSLKVVPSPGNVFRMISEDEYWDGQSLVDYLPVDNFPVKTGDTVRYIQQGITADYYQYLKLVFNITSSNPLLGDPPPANLRGNVTCINNPKVEVLGYFSANSISEKTKIISLE